MNRRADNRRGYTLLELLVVIVIAALLVSLAIPAFRGILASSRRSLAESKLQQAIYSARDAAAASVGGGDAAAVFFFEPGQGVRVLTCIQIGSIEEEIPGGIVGPGVGRPVERRDVFVPLSNYEPVQLPSGLSVRGFALGTLFQGRSGWYEGLESRSATRPPAEPGYWVFPETAFYDAEELAAGATRQTFMIRFSAGEGTLSRETNRALVLSPSTGGSSMVAGFRGLDDAEDLELWAKELISRIDLSEEDRLELFGNDSVHTVLAGPTTEIALYEERDLARAVGSRGLNQTTGTLYLPGTTEPEIDTSIYDGGARVLARNASRWIEGRELIRNAPQQTDSTARVFAINAFFGDLVEITR